MVMYTVVLFNFSSEYIPTASFATQCLPGMIKDGENNFQPSAVCAAKRDVLQLIGGGFYAIYYAL